MMYCSKHCYKHYHNIAIDKLAKELNLPLDDIVGELKCRVADGSIPPPDRDCGADFKAQNDENTFIKVGTITTPAIFQSTVATDTNQILEDVG
ncbi:hypothetical protein BG003_001632 [Podila horticola]|nr:hypothetical protein BG003_001632 [Podila horticola]